MVKLRSSVEDMRKLAFFGYMTPTNMSFTAVFIPVSQVAPRPDDNMAHFSEARPLKPTDYNALSIADVETFASYKAMDDLHKQDAVAADYRGAVTRKQFLRNEGEKEFVKHYSKKK